jgi:hypothetical protein
MIKLEVGKKYLRRDGSTVEIVGYKEGAYYPFRTSENAGYQPDGRHHKYVSSKFDIISELKEDEMNSREIWKAIDGLPICEDGKRGVRELVSKLHPELKLEELPKLKAGQVYYSPSDDSHRLIINDWNGLKAIDMQDGLLASDDEENIKEWITRGAYRLAANSLPEFIEMHKQEGRFR